MLIIKAQVRLRGHSWATLRYGTSSLSWCPTVGHWPSAKWAWEPVPSLGAAVMEGKHNGSSFLQSSWGAIPSCASPDTEWNTTSRILEDSLSLCPLRALLFSSSTSIIPPPSPWLLLLSSLPSPPSCFSSCWAPTTCEVSEEVGVGGPLWNARGVGHEAGWWWSRGRRHLGDLAGTGKEETGFGLSYERTGKARIIWVRGRCEWRSRHRNT